VPSEDVPSDDAPSDEAETFIPLARKHLAAFYIKLATGPLTPAQEAELWRLVEGVEAAVRMRAVLLDLDLDAIDRELEGEIERRCRPVRLPA